MEALNRVVGTLLSYSGLMMANKMVAYSTTLDGQKVRDKGHANIGTKHLKRGATKFVRGPTVGGISAISRTC